MLLTSQKHLHNICAAFFSEPLKPPLRRSSVKNDIRPCLSEHNRMIDRIEDLKKE